MGSPLSGMISDKNLYAEQRAKYSYNHFQKIHNKSMDLWMTLVSQKKIPIHRRPSLIPSINNTRNNNKSLRKDEKTAYISLVYKKRKT